MPKLDLSAAIQFITQAETYGNEYANDPKLYASKVAAQKEVQKAINVLVNFKKSLKTIYHDRLMEKKSKKPVETPAAQADEGTPAE